ncbi:MAG TPA: response regulator [Thermoanaerobaculia bacterium]|jgi:signal transduction histidine kinase/CheY-like chemotaxis protein|nr:response regulator [Thermoanaerobaculia bacterium]
MSTPAPEPSSVLRFDLAIQRNHLLVYTLALFTAFAGRALGVFPLRVDFALGIWAFACACALALGALYKRGLDRRYLNAVWMANDIILLTICVYATGGIDSPCFIWYAATASAAAFAGGRKAAWIGSAANTVAYLGLLLWMGQISFFDAPMGLAVTRMLFLVGASYFFLIGIADLSEKRLRVRQLEAEERAKALELADANQRIKEADKLKSQFLANMSHELRTPMNSIIGFSEILVERLDGKIEPKHLGFLEHIRTSGTHLLGIINDVLDLSKIEAGKMEIYPEYFSIAPVVDSVCQLMRGMTRATQKIVVDIPPDLPQIETDLAKFKQILFNLLSNAVKFSPPDKTIAIRAWLDAGTITVSVRDEGIGIAPENHELIFEEFRQVDGTARREFGGTGLGLALVRKFVELQGGHVTIESRLGAGSTFTFMLPARSRAAVVSRTPEIAVPPALRVLVVEDDANAFELIASALRSAGYFPIRARHGDEAIRLAKDARPAAITLDLVLPGMDGWELLKRLKNDVATRQLPVVIISMVDSRDLGMALGADDYFVKPVDRARLLECLRAITARNGSRRILVIDDDVTIHELLDEDFTSIGYTVHKAFSGEDGLRAAEEHSPDVIILDLMMPGMSGFEVAGALKQNPRTANIPIVVLTSKEISNNDRALLHTKVMSFVQKGSSAQEQLVREIRRVTTLSS